MTRSNSAVLGTSLLVASAVALTACSSGGGSGSGSASAKNATFIIQHYEAANSAQGQGWATAVSIFKKKHPGIKVKVVTTSFESVRNNAKLQLTGDKVPDVMEYNKGNADAGALSSQGLLTNLDKQVAKNGWDKKVTGALASLARYNSKGQAGSGSWYGIPNVAEYYMFYYNKNLFTKYHVAVPKTPGELDQVMQTFKDHGVVPLSTAAGEFPVTQMWYQLSLQNASPSFVQAFQFFKGNVNFHGPEFTSGTTKLAKWNAQGYLGKNLASLTHEQMGVAFINGKYPLMASGSWWFGRLKSEAKFPWGTFLFPQAAMNEGSSGHLWVVPTKSGQKDLAYDWINTTLSPAVQDKIGQLGGLPLAGNSAKITDPQTRQFTQTMNQLLRQNKLALYPDYPVAGFLDEQNSEMQSLVNGKKAPAAVLDGLQKFYDAGKQDIASS